KVNHTGNPGMATAGMGDVLSGIIGAYLAQGADPYSAAVAGAYIHGAAGDIVYRQKGFHMVASDLTEALPAVLRKYDRTNRWTDSSSAKTSALLTLDAVRCTLLANGVLLRAALRCSRVNTFRIFVFTGDHISAPTAWPPPP